MLQLASIHTKGLDPRVGKVVLPSECISPFINLCLVDIFMFTDLVVPFLN